MSVRCCHPGCNERFATDQARRKHYTAVDDHEYCQKCDYLAKDWDDLTLHKATSPVLHICCKFCGQDFKTISGRDRHIKHTHPVDQDLHCIGCNGHFVRAAALIDHLSSGQCSRITSAQFHSAVRHKHMIAKILKNPDSMGPKLIELSANDTDTTGGVSIDTRLSLLDDHNCKIANDPLQLPEGIEVKDPERDVEPKSLETSRLGQNWPALPRSADSTALDRKMSTLSIGAGNDNTGYAARNNSTATSSWKPFSTEDDGRPPASQALFPEARPNPPLPQGWEQAIRAKERESEQANSNNMLTQHFYDPAHKHYNSDRFYDPVIEMYQCPFPQCQDKFVEPSVLRNHIQATHCVIENDCPLCLKKFKTIAALVAHFEALTVQCGISRSNRYGQIIDQYSGGFLGAKDARRPDFTEADREDRYVDARMERKIPGSGYKTGMIKYEATIPPGWPFDALQDNAVQIGRSYNASGSNFPSASKPQPRKKCDWTNKVFENQSTGDIAKASPAQPKPTASKMTKRPEGIVGQLIDPHLYRTHPEFDTELVIEQERPTFWIRPDRANSNSASEPAATQRRSAWL